MLHFFVNLNPLWNPLKLTVMNGFKIRAVFDAKGLRTKKNRIDNRFPIYIRIHKGNPCFFQLDLDNIEEKYWVGQRNSNKWVKATFKEHRFYNEYIDRVISKLKDFIMESMLAGVDLSANDVKSWYEVKYLGKRSNSQVMVKTGDISVQDFFRHATKDLSSTLKPNTIKVYNTTRKQLEKYSPKSRMSEINRDYVKKFVEFLRRDLNLSDESLKKSIDKLKRVYEMYCSESRRVFDRYYFKDLGIKATGIAKTHVSLTADEYEQILNLEIADERLDSVRNIFIFLCNTGLYYNDLKLCEQDNLKNLDGNDDFLVLVGNRQKTQKGFWIPLNKAATSMMAKFRRPGSRYFIQTEFRVHDVTINKLLKELATLARIKKSLTVKVARKAFADWTKRIKLDQDYRNLMAGTLPKGVIERNYTDIRNIDTYKEIIAKLDG